MICWVAEEDLQSDKQWEASLVKSASSVSRIFGRRPYRPRAPNVLMEVNFSQSCVGLEIGDDLSKQYHVSCKM